MNGALMPATVLSASFEEETQQVYNLRATWPHTFLAGDFVVHNKGGGSSRSSSSRSSSSSSRGGSSSSGGASDFGEGVVGIIAFIGVFTVLVIVFIIIKRKGGKGRKSRFRVQRRRGCP